MTFIKKYKNFIFLVLIVSVIVFSPNIFEFAKSAYTKIEKIFSASKPDYSNLSSQGYKVKSSSSNTSKPTKSSSSDNQGAKSMFKKPEPTPEDLDKEIMAENPQDQQNNQKDQRFKKAKRDLNKAVDENQMANEKFDVDVEKEFDKF